MGGLIPTHPVNIPCGTEREYPQRTHDFWQSVTGSFRMSGALGSSGIENVLTEDRTRNLRGERRAL